MKSKLLILIFLSLLFISHSVKSQVENNEKKTKLELEIIAQTIPVLVSPIKFPPPPIFTGTEEEKILFIDSINNVKEKYKLRVDTTDFFIYLADSLFIPRLNFDSSYHNNDYNGLLKLLTSEKLKAKSLNISLVEKRINYKVLSTKLWENKTNYSFGNLGIAAYSRIVFNEKFTQALFNFERYPRISDGSGHLILAEKKNGKWNIIESDMIWIE